MHYDQKELLYLCGRCRLNGKYHEYLPTIDNFTGSPLIALSGPAGKIMEYEINTNKQITKLVRICKCPRCKSKQIKAEFAVTDMAGEVRVLKYFKCFDCLLTLESNSTYAIKPGDFDVKW